MALSEAVSELNDRWTQLTAQLDTESLGRLLALVDVLGAAPTDEVRTQSVQRILELLKTELPGDPIMSAILELQGTSRLAGAKDGLQDQIRRLVELGRPGAARAKPSVDAVILAAPSISAKSMRRGGGDPDQSGLIRLRRADGSVALPRFQFTTGGQPRSLVLRINQLLGADSDPWGVADWWLCPNAWLDATPVDLIDRFDDRTLVAAALAAVEG